MKTALLFPIVFLDFSIVSTEKAFFCYFLIFQISSLNLNNIFKIFNSFYSQKHYFITSYYWEKLSSLHNSIFGSFHIIYLDNISFHTLFNIFISYYLLFPIVSSNLWIGISNYNFIFFYFYYVDISFFLQPLISCFTLVVLLNFSISFSLSHAIFTVISILFYFQNSSCISNCTTM